MKKFTKILVAFMSFSLIACNNQTSNVSSNEESSSTIVDNSSENEASSTISESSTSSDESSSSVEESSSSTEESSSSVIDSSSIEDSSSEEILYDNAFMVGYGSYVKDNNVWNDEGGVKLDLVNDTPDALEKYVTTIDLKVGDVFMLHVLNEILTYEIDQILIVEPHDTDPLLIEPGKDLCTMITCTPYGINSHRLLVRGHRVENQSEAIRVTSDAIQIEPLLVAPAVALPILLILLIVLLASGGKKKPKGGKGNANA